ncbi:MAG: transposase [Ktedonobacteraceae bacterium]
MDDRRFDPKTYTRRNSNHLTSYDYRSSGAYFITICTQNRQRVLDIPIMHTAVLEKWQQFPQRFPTIRVDEFVVMPDHVHGMLWLDGTLKDAPTVGKVIGAFKAWVTIVWRVTIQRPISPASAISGREIIMSMCFAMPRMYC